MKTASKFLLGVNKLNQENMEKEEFNQNGIKKSHFKFQIPMDPPEQQ